MPGNKKAPADICGRNKPGGAALRTLDADPAIPDWTPLACGKNKRADEQGVGGILPVGSHPPALAVGAVRL
jgi:hypothetical protein